MTPPTDFISLKKTISELLQCNSVRSPRTIDVIYSSLQVGSLLLWQLTL
jgi:hypothetical protein